MENLATILGYVATIFESIIGWLGDILEVITTNPVLFITVVAIPVAGVAIGYLRRLFSLTA